MCNGLFKCRTVLPVKYRVLSHISAVYLVVRAYTYHIIALTIDLFCEGNRTNLSQAFLCIVIMGNPDLSVSFQWYRFSSSRDIPLTLWKGTSYLQLYAYFVSATVPPSRQTHARKLVDVLNKDNCGFRSNLFFHMTGNSKFNLTICLH